MANGFLFKPATISSVTASNTASGYSASNVADDRMGLVWKSSTGSSTRSLTIDLGADTSLNTITLHGLTGAQSGWQWAIDLATAAQGAFSGSYWSGSAETLLAGSTMPQSGKGRALWQAPVGAPAAVRYVRINFSSLSSAAVEVARVCIGQRITLGRNFAYGAALAIRPLGSAGFSIRGNLLRRRGAKLRGIGVSVDGATRAEVEASVMPLYEQCGNDETVVLVLDPDADAQRQNRIWYGLLQGDLGAVWARVDGFTCQFNIVALD